MLLGGSETYLKGDYSKLNIHINVDYLTPAVVSAINLESTRLTFLTSCKSSGVGSKPFNEAAESILQGFYGAGTQTLISTL